MTSDKDRERDKRLNDIQMMDLGTARREHIMTVDRRTEFDRVPMALVEAERAANVVGTEAYTRRQQNQDKINAWSNAFKVLEQEETEDIQTFKDGQSHRARLNASMKNDRGLDPWEDLYSNRAFGGGRGGRSCARGRGGGVVGSRGRRDIFRNSTAETHFPQIAVSSDARSDDPTSAVARPVPSLNRAFTVRLADLSLQRPQLSKRGWSRAGKASVGGKSRFDLQMEAALKLQDEKQGYGAAGLKAPGAPNGGTIFVQGSHGQSLSKGPPQQENQPPRRPVRPAPPNVNYESKVSSPEAFMEAFARSQLARSSASTPPHAHGPEIKENVKVDTTTASVARKSQELASQEIGEVVTTAKEQAIVHGDSAVTQSPSNIVSPVPGSESPGKLTDSSKDALIRFDDDVDYTQIGQQVSPHQTGWPQLEDHGLLDLDNEEISTQVLRPQSLQKVSKDAKDKDVHKYVDVHRASGRSFRKEEIAEIATALSEFSENLLALSDSTIDMDALQGQLQNILNKKIEEGVGQKMESCDEAAMSVRHSPEAPELQNILNKKIEEGVGQKMESCDEAAMSVRHSPEAPAAEPLAEKLGSGIKISIYGDHLLPGRGGSQSQPSRSSAAGSSATSIIGDKILPGQGATRTSLADRIGALQLQSSRWAK